jgi:hypothetical protein
MVQSTKEIESATEMTNKPQNRPGRPTSKNGRKTDAEYARSYRERKKAQKAHLKENGLMEVKVIMQQSHYLALNLAGEKLGLPSGVILHAISKTSLDDFEDRVLAKGNAEIADLANSSILKTSTLAQLTEAKERIERFNNSENTDEWASILTPKELEYISIIMLMTPEESRTTTPDPINSEQD